jgi:hypothetical protein
VLEEMAETLKEQVPETLLKFELPILPIELVTVKRWATDKVAVAELPRVAVMVGELLLSKL